MSRKIIGRTVGTTIPKPNLSQTDPKKGDYVHGKDAVGNIAVQGLGFRGIDGNQKILAYWEDEITDEQGKPDGQVLGIYGDAGGGPVVLRGIHDPLFQEDATNKGYVDGIAAEIWAEIRYAPIAISNFRHSAGTVELGTVLESVDLSWSLNKDPAQQSLNGVLLPSVAREVTAPGPFSKTTKFSLSVTDERDAPDTASTTVYFYNAVYYGTHTGTAMPTDEQLRALPKKLQSGRGLDLKGNAGVGQYLIYACPTSYGTPEFWYNGIQGGFYKLGTMLHTNASGHKENYDIWLSGADELGTRTITVK